MRTSICLLKLCFLFFILACKSESHKSESYLHSLIDSLSISKEKNIIIYSFNPNDCINCLYGFNLIYNELATKTNSKLFVVSVEREIEKKELIRTTKNISFSDSINKVVLWNKQLFTMISKSTNHPVPVSLVTIYNYNTDSVIYSKAVKEIENANELNPYF
jgi:hypothetical protein